MRQSTVAAGADGGGIGKERQHCTNNNNGEGGKINEKNNNELTAGTSQRRSQEKAEIVHGTPSPTMALEWHLGVSGSGSRLLLPCLTSCLLVLSFLGLFYENHAVVPAFDFTLSSFPWCGAHTTLGLSECVCVLLGLRIRLLFRSLVRRCYGSLSPSLFLGST